MPAFSDTIICEKMGWTYQELMDTPEEFLVALYARLEVENKFQAKQQEEIKRSVKKSKRH